MNRVVHFEIQADDTARAIKFYTDVFGWTFQKWEGSPSEYHMIMTAEKDSKELGINGGLMPRPCPAPAPEQGTNAYTCTMQVEDFDDIAKKIEAAGGNSGNRRSRRIIISKNVIQLVHRSYRFPYMG